MNLEGITLHSLTAYLKQEVTGSRIYKIGMPSNHMVYFSLKRESDTIHFIIDVNPASPAIRLTTEAPDNPQEPPAFCMLLRKHLEEGRITRIRQYGLDRVIELEISLLGRSSQILTKQIIIELTGKNANLIFAENGKDSGQPETCQPLYELRSCNPARICLQPAATTARVGYSDCFSGNDRCCHPR